MLRPVIFYGLKNNRSFVRLAHKKQISIDIFRGRNIMRSIMTKFQNGILFKIFMVSGGEK
jgi:hypothetical protein